ncbi:MAG: autotransporter domain-containing protein [Pseudolabrys sp.]
MLSSTALSAGILFTSQVPALADPPTEKFPLAHAKRNNNSPAKASTLDPEIAAALNWSLHQGRNGLLASVFDATHRHPGQRDAVLSHARTLGPGLTRDLTTAADLGVLTAGHDLRLSPRGVAALNARGAMATGSFAATGPAAGPASAMAPTAFAPPTMPSAGNQTWHLDMIKADVANGRGYTGSGVAVAVGDTGFDLTHPSLATKFDLTRAYSNMVVNGETYNPNYAGIQWTGDSHGTHVAGIIGAKRDASLSDFRGVAYDASIVPIRMIFDTYIADNNLAQYMVSSPLADGINYFTSLTNVKVMNASFGPNAPEQPQRVWSVDRSDLSEAIAAQRALAADKIIVAAAGNDRDDHPTAGKNPSGLALLPFVRPEHTNTNVYDDHGLGLDFSSLLDQQGLIIGVMSVGKNKAPAYYSNYCGVTASWCVAAPGGDQKLGADGGVFSTVPVSKYDYMQGTSMAAPVVTGAIAVLIQAYPGYTARDLAQVLFSTTEDLGTPGIDAIYGHGLIRLDRATDGPTTLAANHTETVAADTTTYWSQPLTTTGAFNKAGDGILTIAGRTTAPGDVTVNAGTLAVDGTLSVTGTGNALIVNPTGALAGMGLINGDTTVAGLLSPGKMANVQDLLANGSITSASQAVGNSAGTLTFNGNVALTATATTRIDIDGWYVVPGGPGTFDKIVVTGAGHTFTANGALTPVLRDSVGTPSNYMPAIGSRFDFVQAINGAKTAGAFTSLAQPADGLPTNGRFDLIYSPSAITLHVTPVSFAALAQSSGGNPTDNRISGILDQFRSAPGSIPLADTKPLYDALYGLNSATEYGTAVHELGAPGTPAVTSASMSGMQGFMGSVSDRQDALSGGTGNVQTATAQSVAFAYASRTMSAQASRAEAAFASLTPVTPSPDSWGVWAQGFGRWSSVNDNGGLSGAVSRSGGFTVGADRLLAPDLIGGMAFGFARTISTSGNARATSDSYTGALYASWTPGAAVIDLRAAAGPSRIQTTRDLLLTPAPVQGNANGFGGGVALEAGYRIPFGAGTIKPFANVAWQGFRRDSYTETQQPFGLAFPSQYFEKVTTTIGATLSTQTRFANGATLMPEFKLGWAHDWRDTTLVTQAALLDQPFIVNGAQPGRDAAVFGVKFAGWTQENFRLFVAYQGELRSNAASHQLSGGARYTW